VHTVIEYYDGPRRGIADFNGKPHFFESDFRDVDDGERDTFNLYPLSVELFLLAMEDWAIWLRWHDAYSTGTATIESHPALPEDRERHDELERLLRWDKLVQTPPAARMHGQFDALPGARNAGTTARGFLVQWTPIETPRYAAQQDDEG
ncbi:MAG: hypothetical protein RIG82_03445, partial [Phycisphaeraceae bacterium]